MAGERAFTYVRIPVDPSLPLSECSGSLVHVGDVLPDLLKPVFADGRTIDEDAARAQATLHLGQDQAHRLDVKALQNATALGSVETFALVRPSRTNGMTGAYLYMDEVGALKGLPLNARAVQLAHTCGFDRCQFYGDVFAGRVRTEPVPAGNVDLKVGDLDSSSEWLKRAALDNIEYNMEVGRLKDTMAAKGMKPDAKEDRLRGQDTTRGYSWSQEDDQMEVSVDIPENVVKGDIRVNFTSTAVVVTLKGEERLRLGLFAPVETGECTWTFSRGKLVLSLEKASPGPWASLVKA
eukprot:TRINITY_DN5084_c0_g1_i1.p1 TRINITY_DN5084_c0_g1~~TRINITY_DN5084_c0_g1_i1.p1  ORF type:complete len:294 (+),score=50.82 TRINITY_DN5084_c0_g1_i1:45-926(+)